MSAERDKVMINWFVFHPATPDTGPVHDYIREEFLGLAQNLMRILPDNPDRTVAIRALQSAMWAANSAVACRQAGE